MNVEFQPDPNIVTFRVIGGSLDFYIFLGPRPDEVIAQYTSLIGRPMMPPYWGLGFQLCRYGYANLTFLNMIWTRNRLAGIPQDIQYADIDYTDGQKGFTYDQKRFAGFPDFIDKLHSNNQKLVLITEPGVSSTADGYEPRTVGLEMGIFIKDASGSKPFVGKCWPGETHWVDFTHPNCSLYWTKMHQSFHDVISFDGDWLDMNEPASFVTGSAMEPTGCAANRINYPPYNPLTYNDMNSLTVCLDAKQYAGTHYRLHNMYGHMESIATNYALRQLFPGKRPFLVSRSTFPGSGAHTAHWTGDVFSTWGALGWSIITMLEFNMFGIPWVGADICGFQEETTEELCVRWHQLGAFYPFSRNHNDLDSKVEQDPAAWSPRAVAAIRSALLLRYKLLPYLYTLFFDAHTKGVTVARPMFFEFPHDPATWNMSSQFLWGRGLMIVPILDKGAIERQAYFPKGRWFDFFSSGEVPSSDVGRNQTLPLPLEKIGLYVQGGSIVPWQLPGVTTVESRLNPFGITVAPDANGHAIGSLFWDDGESLNSIEEGSFNYYKMSLSQLVNGSQELKVMRNSDGYYPATPMQVGYVWIFGVVTKPTSVQLNGNTLDTTHWEYNSGKRSLNIRPDLLLSGEQQEHILNWH